MVSSVVMADVNNDDDVEQYNPVLDLEQDEWNFADWRHPDSNNVSASSSDGDGDVSMGDEEVGSPEVADSPEVAESNDYIRKLVQSTDLHILQPGVVNAAYEGVNKELGLFHLFMTQNFLGVVCNWTNEVLESKGKRICSIQEFNGYLGLELGMSIVKYNDIKKYWAEGAFLGHSTFIDTMSRTRFQEIRGSISLSSRSHYDGDTANDDPLWSCRSVLDQFIRKSAAIAVPVGVSALDENSCATKARTRAKTYLPSKPDKYAIRFYAVVGHKYVYLSSMFDNRAGNKTGVSGVQDYCRLFRSLRTPYYKVTADQES